MVNRWVGHFPFHFSCLLTFYSVLFMYFITFLNSPRAILYFCWLLMFPMVRCALAGQAIWANYLMVGRNGQRKFLINTVVENICGQS